MFGRLGNLWEHQGHCPGRIRRTSSLIRNLLHMPLLLPALDLALRLSVKNLWPPPSPGPLHLASQQGSQLRGLTPQRQSVSPVQRRSSGWTPLSIPVTPPPGPHVPPSLPPSSPYLKGYITRYAYHILYTHLCLLCPLLGAYTTDCQCKENTHTFIQ